MRDTTPVAGTANPARCVAPEPCRWFSGVGIAILIAFFFWKNQRQIEPEMFRTMQTSFRAEESFLRSFNVGPRRWSCYLTDILPATGAALVWIIVLPVAALFLLAAALGRRIGEMTRRMSRVPT